jgi:hypothetical protein
MFLKSYLSLRFQVLGVWMAQVVEQLPNKHEALSLNPITAKKKKEKKKKIENKIPGIGLT